MLVGATRRLQAQSVLDTGRSVVRNFSGQMSRPGGLGLRTYAVAFPLYPRIPLSGSALEHGALLRVRPLRRTGTM